MSTPKISIIIPIHNVEPYIDRCVMSVRKQTLKDIEIILVENLSTDNSLEKCRQHAAADSRVKVLTLDVADLSSARNAGVKVAQAPFVGFADSDDWIEEDMYETLLDAIKSNNADMAYCNYMLDYEDGTVKYPFKDTGKISVLDARQAQRDIIMERATSASWVRLYRKELFDKFQFPEGRYFEDHCSIYRWTADCQRLVHVDRPLYHYFMRTDSICSSLLNNPRKVVDFFDAEFDRLEYIEENNLFTDPNELYEARSYIIKQSITHLKTYTSAMPRATLKDPELKRMRQSLLKCLRYTRQEIKPRTYNKLRRIAYIWPIYYLLHRKPNAKSSRHVAQKA